MSNSQNSFKVMLIGHEGVGKTQFLNQYINSVFSDKYVNTIGIDFKIKTCPAQKEIKLQVWDTAGQERYRKLSLSYIAGAHALVLFVDPTQPLNTQISEYAPHIPENTPVIVVISKSDIIEPYQVFTQIQLEKKLQEENIKCESIFSISAKTGENVDLVGEKLVALAEEKFKQEKTNQSQQTFRISKPNSTPKNDRLADTISTISYRVMQTIKNNPYKTALLTGAVVGVVLSATGVFGVGAFGIAVLGAIGAVVFVAAMLVARTIWACKSNHVKTNSIHSDVNINDNTHSYQSTFFSPEQTVFMTKEEIITQLHGRNPQTLKALYSYCDPKNQSNGSSDVLIIPGLMDESNQLNKNVRKEDLYNCLTKEAGGFIQINHAAPFDDDNDNDHGESPSLK